MKDIYTISLDEKIFDKVLKGKTNFYVEINNKTNQAYKVGNLLTIKSSNPLQVEEVSAQVLKIYYFNSIKELIDMIGKENCGYTFGMSVDSIEDKLYTRFSAQDVEKYGLIAIEFDVTDIK